MEKIKRRCEETCVRGEERKTYEGGGVSVRMNVQQYFMGGVSVRMNVQQYFVGGVVQYLGSGDSEQQGIVNNRG